MGRGKSPSDNTVRILCGKAAGMCEFEGCNKRLFYDGVTLREFNNAFVAHIVASSANGPRGDKVLSPQLSDIDGLKGGLQTNATNSTRKVGGHTFFGE